MPSSTQSLLQCLLLSTCLMLPRGVEYVSPLHEYGETALSCTDDSDCVPLGHKFGCFLYRCSTSPAYHGDLLRCMNYLESPQPQCQLGRDGQLCGPGEQCHYHPILRSHQSCTDIYNISSGGKVCVSQPLNYRPVLPHPTTAHHHR